MPEYKRLPVDSRIVKDIQSSPMMYSEQGSGFMQRWGGPGMYRTMARLPMEARVSYYTIVELQGGEEGRLVTADEIETASGLSSQEVSRGVDLLRKEGLVT